MSNISVTIDTDKEQKRTSDVPALCQKADLIISNQTEYDGASVILKEVKSRYKELDEQRKEITKPLDTAKKAVMDLFNRPLDLLKRAEDKLKGGMIGYTNEIERKAREDQARLQKLADQEAEKQRKILEAKIERAKASGKEEKVADLEMQKETVVPIMAPVITPQIENPNGTSYRDKWDVEIVNVDLIPREYMLPNLQAIQKIIQATKGTIPIPGVKIIKSKILVSR